jgi:hypothetical protein
VKNNYHILVNVVPHSPEEARPQQSTPAELRDLAALFRARAAGNAPLNDIKECDRSRSPTWGETKAAMLDLASAWEQAAHEYEAKGAKVESRQLLFRIIPAPRW